MRLGLKGNSLDAWSLHDVDLLHVTLVVELGVNLLVDNLGDNLLGVVVVLGNSLLRADHHLRSLGWESLGFIRVDWNSNSESL